MQLVGNLERKKERFNMSILDISLMVFIAVVAIGSGIGFYVYMKKEEVLK
jgi:flagellar basal body-associated protein FliL